MRKKKKKKKKKRMGWNGFGRQNNVKKSNLPLSRKKQGL